MLLTLTYHVGFNAALDQQEDRDQFTSFVIVPKLTFNRHINESSVHISWQHKMLTVRWFAVSRTVVPCHSPDGWLTAFTVMRIMSILKLLTSLVLSPILYIHGVHFPS